MASYRLKRFTNPAILKKIHRPLLVRLFEPFRLFLAGRGMELIDDDRLAYDTLASILMSPDENTPEELLDTLYFVDEISLPQYYDDLLTEAQDASIDLSSENDISPADLAVRVWLANRNIVERLHAERFLVTSKSFESFLSTASVLPDVRQPSEASLAALEKDLSDWFETKKRGRGTRVFPVFRENVVWLLVRHGEPLKREGAMQDGKPSSIYYRPERFDVLSYYPEIGELAIHAGTKGEKRTYCELIGKYIFGSEAFFDVDGREGKYTLQPIREDWRGCVACADVPGIEEIRLAELHFRHDSFQYHVEVHKADDVFAALEDIDRKIPPTSRLLRASFKVRFKNAVRPRTVVIRPPSVAIYDRESDSDLVNEWLTKRGFVKLEPEAQDAVAIAALEVP